MIKDFVSVRGVKEKLLNSSLKIFQYQLIKKIYFESHFNADKFHSKFKEILKTNPNLRHSN